MLIQRIHKFLYSAERNDLLNLKVEPIVNELLKHVCQRNFLKLLNKMFGKYVVNENIICLSAH